MEAILKRMAFLLIKSCLLYIFAKPLNESDYA
jgi:hypothetical protein